MDDAAPVSLRTLGGYLLGLRASIASVAADPRSWKIGLALAFAASVAREYDAEYLVAEPWHVLFGPAASLVAALILALVLDVVFAPHSRGGPGTVPLARRFLGLFWMTAPLAFLYAIPVERFLGDVDAMRANLALLGLVAAWRVVLMIRVVSVAYGVGPITASFPIMLVSASLALFAVDQLDVQIFMIMGGIHYTPAQVVLREVASTVAGLAMLTLPVWAVGTVVVMVRTWRKPTPLPAFRLDPESPVSRAPYAVAAVAIVALVPAMPTTQSEQALRHEVEAALGRGDADAAIELMESRPHADFPPHFRPNAALRLRVAEALRRGASTVGTRDGVTLYGP